MGVKKGLPENRRFSGNPKKELEIIITPEGEVKVTTRGVKGKACLELTKFLEESLGEVKERKFTADYYEGEVYITEKEKAKTSGR